MDEALVFPLSLGWTLVPSMDLKIEAQENCTQDFSSVTGQDVLQFNTGVDLEASL